MYFRTAECRDSLETSQKSRVQIPLLLFYFSRSQLEQVTNLNSTSEQFSKVPQNSLKQTELLQTNKKSRVQILLLLFYFSRSQLEQVTKLNSASDQFQKSTLEYYRRLSSFRRQERASSNVSVKNSRITIPMASQVKLQQLQQARQRLKLTESEGAQAATDVQPHHLSDS